MLQGFFIVTIAALILSAQARAEFGCVPNEEFEAHDFAGEVYGDHDYTAVLGIHKFVLARNDYGWEIEIFRSAGPQLPVRTAPLGNPAPNLTVVSGMDYRTPDNVHSVPGPVIRKFLFGHIAVDPIVNPELIAPSSPAVEPNEGDSGIGELIVEDIGITDLGKGKTARLTYMKFSGCVGWNRGYRGPHWRGNAHANVPDTTVSAMKHCGFDETTYRLSNWMQSGSEYAPAWYLEPDLMGDGYLDFVAPASRLSDGKNGLAICLRGDNRLKMSGFDSEDDVADLAGSANYWSVTKGAYSQGITDEPPPEAAGDAIVMGIEGATSMLLYMDANENILFYQLGD